MNAPGVLPARAALRVGLIRQTIPEVRDLVSAADIGDARDNDLLRRIGRRDEEAFRALFRSYAPTARALALRILRQPFLADDIVQEAFLTIWDAPGRYDPGRGSVRAWLMTTVHHRAVDLVRREESHRRRAEGAPLEPAPEDPAEQAIIHFNSD